MSNNNEEIFPFIIIELLIYISFIIGYPYNCTIYQNFDIPNFLQSFKRSYLPLADEIMNIILDFFKEANPKIRIHVFSGTNICKNII